MQTSKQVLTTYYGLTLMTTLAASFIWGINTLFLLDAGLTNTEAFAANAFFTAGMVLFEIPTGVVADTSGRRISFLIGSVTLLLSTLAYWLMWHQQAPFYAWALASMFLGFGFTFFSGAVEAWLVDALDATHFQGSLDTVFSRNQMVSGIAMLIGSISGGLIAQFSNLGVPYVIRALMLIFSFVFAFIYMKDLGFSPVKDKTAMEEVRFILAASIEHGWRQPTVQKLMLSAPFTAGVFVYAFYAMQPYLLELYGNSEAYAVAGLAAAIVAGSQMIGSMMVPRLLKRFKRRTSIILLCLCLSAVMMFLIGLANSFYIAIALFMAWAIILSAMMPVRQALLNRLIPSEQRATVLSFDSLMSSSGGVVSQPLLGRSADVWSYGMSYLICATVQLIAIPITLLARRTCSDADKTTPERSNATGKAR